MVVTTSFEEGDMEREEMMLSKGYFEIVAEIYYKLRQLSTFF